MHRSKQDCGQHRDPDRTAQRAKERGARRRDAELIARNGVLHGDERRGQHDADRQADQRHQHAGHGCVSRRHVGQTQQADRNPRRADQLQGLVAAGPVHDAAADEGAQRNHERQRKQPPRGFLGRGTGDHLKTERRQRRDGNELKEAHEHDAAACGHQRNAKQIDRNDRLGRARLVKDAESQNDECRRKKFQIARIVPRDALTDSRDRQQQSGQSHDQQRRAEIVDAAFDSRDRQMRERAARHQKSRGTQRQVDPEDPPPCQVMREQTADHRAGHARDREHAADVALIAAAFAQRHDVGDDGLGDRDQSAAADALYDARDDQLRHRLRQRACDRGDQEYDDRDRQQHAPAEEIAELAVDRRNHRRCHEITRNDPRDQREAVELLRHARQGDGDDGLIECAQKDREHQTDDDAAPLGVRERRGRCRRRCH